MKNLKEHLEMIRGIRNFNTLQYINKKVIKINKFFTENNLDSAVIGISGGIDSAVTFKLLLEAQKQTGSPIKKLLPLIVPIHGSGTSNQEKATELANKFLMHENEISQYKFDKVYFDLTSAYKKIICGHILRVNNNINEPLKNSNWADGQMASVLRTPIFYYYAALLQENGYRSIVVGTTNRDEGSYIGFFGKASDGMVDLQPIADMHKSEVYKVAKELQIIPEIINATPKGDVWDNKTDVEMIGAPYDFIELYTSLLNYGFPSNQIYEYQNEEDTKLFAEYQKNVELIHNKNLHKYQVGSPAHFIDVIHRKVQGGWE